jgi:hypothetical protein
MPTPRAVRDQLERVLGSGAFAGSDRLSSFLRFAVEATLFDRAAELEEYTIAVEV